jgi:hypothetical protein
MGIYPSDDIYGIRIYDFIDDVSNILFERKYDVIMTKEMLNDIKLVYEELCENNKDQIFFQIYTECSSTYDKDKFMNLIPINLNIFLQKLM